VITLMIDADIEDADWPKRTDDLMDSLMGGQSTTVLSAAVFTLSCDTCGEFECKSKACAPPPIGTGGSLPDGASEAGEGSGSSGSGGTAVSEGFQPRNLFGEESSVLGFRSDFDKLPVAMRMGIRGDAKRAAVQTLTESVLSDTQDRKVFDDLLSSERTADSDVHAANIILRSGVKVPILQSEIVDRMKGASFGEAIGSILELGGMNGDAESVRRFVVETSANIMLRDWAESSNEGSQSKMRQAAAAAVHGLKDDTIAGWEMMNPAEFAIAKALTRAEYRATQEFLKREVPSGVVTLVRGVTGQHSEAQKGDVVEVETNALSSWAGDFRTAHDFAGSDGTVLAMEVPIEQIQSTWRTGRGCMEEYEAILIGRPSKARIVE